jgi:hypothetical protein
MSSEEEVRGKKRPVDSEGEENEDSNDEWVGPKPTANDQEDNSASQEDDSNGFGVDLNLREDKPEEKPEVVVKKRKSSLYIFLISNLLYLS